MLKVCLWTNIKSQLNSAFFAAAAADPRLDVRVCYFLPHVTSSRLAQGFLEEPLAEYECAVQDGRAIDTLRSIPEYRERIHIFNYAFSSELVQYLAEQGIRWCHWSEMPGIGLYKLVNFHRLPARLLFPLLRWKYRKMAKMITAHGLGAFGVGSCAMRFFEQCGVPAEKTALLFYGTAPVPAAPPRSDLVQWIAGRTSFISVAALNRRKGIDVLLRAVARCGKECCLVLAGKDQSEGVYPRLVQKLGIEDRVLFLGPVPANELATVYAAIDVMVLASRFDGWGAVLNEAASAGKPLIATDAAGASAHLIRENVNGYRVRADSVSALAEALSHYAGNPETVKAHGAASKALYDNEFSPQCDVDGLVKALERWS